MLSIISPAKNMKRKSVYDSIAGMIDTRDISRPSMLQRSELLRGILKAYNPFELESLMKINEQLAAQAFMDYQDMSLKDTGTAALLTYDGLVYKNIEPHTLTSEEIQFANSSVRILSAFYGLLRPLDGILPYRLEMQCRLNIDGQNLYKYWKNELYDSLYGSDNIIVNLASEEYAKCIRKYLFDSDQFIDIEFLTMKNGKLKSLATWAKMARGQMIRYIIKEQITKPEKLKDFNWNGYEFEPSLSYSNKYVFIL